MTPDEIKRLIQANYQNIAITARNNPDREHSSQIDVDQLRWLLAHGGTRRDAIWMKTQAVLRWLIPVESCGSESR